MDFAGSLHPRRWRQRAAGDTGCKSARGGVRLQLFQWSGSFPDPGAEHLMIETSGIPQHPSIEHPLGRLGRDLTA
jgi:hypothetical protein